LLLDAARRTGRDGKGKKSKNKWGKMKMKLKDTGRMFDSEKRVTLSLVSSVERDGG